MIVLDASFVVTALLDEADAGERATARLRQERIAVPELLDLEVLHAVRRLTQVEGRLPDRRAEQALDDLEALPFTRYPHRPLLGRCWELRANLTPYDAVYVALAEALDAPLLTADARLARATGPRCPFELFED